MAIEINGIVYRNLQQQVAYLSNKVAALEQEHEKQKAETVVIPYDELPAVNRLDLPDGVIKDLARQEGVQRLYYLNLDEYDGKSIFLPEGDVEAPLGDFNTMIAWSSSNKPMILCLNGGWRIWSILDNNNMGEFYPSNLQDGQISSYLVSCSDQDEIHCADLVIDCTGPNIVIYHQDTDEL